MPLCSCLAHLASYLFVSISLSYSAILSCNGVHHFSIHTQDNIGFDNFDSKAYARLAVLLTLNYTFENTHKGHNKFKTNTSDIDTALSCITERFGNVSCALSLNTEYVLIRCVANTSLSEHGIDLKV